MGHRKARRGQTATGQWAQQTQPGEEAALASSSDSAVLPWISRCPSLDLSSASNKERAAVGDF